MPTKPLRDLELSNESEKIINIAQQSAESTKNDAKGKKTIVIIAINLLTLALITIFSSKFFGENILFSGWYWIAIFAITIIGLIAWTEGNVSTKIAKKVSIAFCGFAFFMVAVTSIWPNFNVKGLRMHENASVAPTCLKQLFVFNKWEEISTVSVPDRATIHINANKAFYIVERYSINDDGTEKLTKIKMPPGESKRYFTWGGTVRVAGIYDDTKLNITFY